MFKWFCTVKKLVKTTKKLVLSQLADSFSV